MYTIFPGAAIIQGIFPSQTVAGRICLLENLIKGSGDFPESEAYKLLLFHLFFPLLNISIIIYLRLRVRRFLGDLCPRNQMSCIGMYKRNVISLKTTIVWLIIWDVSALIDCGFQALLSMEPSSQVWSREVVFWIWNIKGFLFNEGLHLTLPSFLEIPTGFDRQKVKKAFYARHPGSLEPRRESEGIGTNPQNARREEDKGAQQQKEQNNSLLLSARELLLVKVPARLIKVAEYKAECKHKNKYENKAENMGPGRWQDWSKYAVISNGLSTAEKESLRRIRLELSIPENYVDEHLGDHGEHYGFDHCDQRLTVYCRKHKSFASHLYT